MPFREIVLDMRDRLARELTAAVDTLRLRSSQPEFGMQVRQLPSDLGGTGAGGELLELCSLLFLIVSLALKAFSAHLDPESILFFSQIFSAFPGIDSSASEKVSAVIARNT